MGSKFNDKTHRRHGREGNVKMEVMWLQAKEHQRMLNSHQRNRFSTRGYRGRPVLPHLDFDCCPLELLLFKAVSCGHLLQKAQGTNALVVTTFKQVSNMNILRNRTNQNRAPAMSGGKHL
jgi:hypothetical protein